MLAIKFKEVITRAKEKVIFYVYYDYRLFNNVLKKNATLLPNYTFEIDKVAGYRHYTFLNLKDSF